MALRATAGSTALRAIVIAKLPKDSRLHRFVEPLTTAVDAAARALQRRIEVWSARSGVRLDVEDWKQGTNALRMSIYGELVKIAAANGYGRNWAETFFRPPDGDDEKDLQVPPPSPPGAPEA